jgi:hypothetical protein
VSTLGAHETKEADGVGRPRGPSDGNLFRAAGEFWNEYLVDDGSVLRLKIVMTEVNRLEGEYDDHGQPVYAIKSVNAMRVSAPKHLRRGEAAS